MSEQRIAALEAHMAEANLREAVRVERDVHMNARFDKLEQTMEKNNLSQTEATNKINEKIGKVVWLVIAAILAAVMNTVLGGVGG